MEKIVNTLIDEAVQKVDTYTNNGSTWLIFTDDKRWVIELTKDGTLWYNYNFFNGLFAYASMDVIENQHYITKWVENNVINKKKPVKNEVKETELHKGDRPLSINDTIQNGVKYTSWHEPLLLGTKVEDTIQNGVKNTYSDKMPHEYDWTDQFDVKEVIDTGVKHTEKSLQIDGSCVIEDVIKEGVKHTEYGDWEDGDERLDDIIKNGVKETNMEEHHRLREVVQTVKNGIKETCAQIPSIDAVVERVVEEGIKETHDDVYPHTARIEGVIKNGIKEVQPLPAQDGNRDWGVYYYRKEDRTKPHTQYVNDVIENGEKI